MNKVTATIAVILAAFVQLTLITLQLTGVIALNWAVVLLPIILLGVGIVIAGGCLAGIAIYGIASFIDVERKHYGRI